MPVLNAKTLVILGLATLLVPAGLATRQPPAAVHPSVITVTIPAGDFAYRLSGDFRLGTAAVDGPRVLRHAPNAFSVMKKQVSVAEYDLCVADRSCAPRDARAPSGSNMPAVGMSWNDATSYARWLSAKTGVTWRLPTDEEWTRAAGSRAGDDAIAVAAGSFIARQLARYEQEAARARLNDPAPRPLGAFGENEHGVADIAGNVWEWTDTCLTRQSLDADGDLVGEPVVNCGVRVVAGKHRSYMTDFIRDPKSGGCSFGTPPANLGFRLVRDLA